MPPANSRTSARQKRHSRLRLRVAGSAERPRLAVFRSINQIYAQVIDDASGPYPCQRLLDGSSPCEAPAAPRPNGPGRSVQLVGERARAAGVERVVFDRAGFKYHGRIRSLAEGAREAGLDF